MEVVTMVGKEEKVTPGQFLKRSISNKNNTQSVKIIPPKLGEKGFGKIAVTRKRPTYRPAVNE